MPIKNIDIIFDKEAAPLDVFTSGFAGNILERTVYSMAKFAPLDKRFIDANGDLHKYFRLFFCTSIQPATSLIGAVGKEPYCNAGRSRSLSELYAIYITTFGIKISFADFLYEFLLWGDVPQSPKIHISRCNTVKKLVFSVHKTHERVLFPWTIKDGIVTFNRDSIHMHGNKGLGEILYDGIDESDIIHILNLVHKQKLIQNVIES